MPLHQQSFLSFLVHFTVGEFNIHITTLPRQTLNTQPFTYWPFLCANLYHCKKLRVDLTLERSSQLQSGLIQVQAVVHLLFAKVQCYTPCSVKVSVNVLFVITFVCNSHYTVKTGNVLTKIMLFQLNVVHKDAESQLQMLLTVTSKIYQSLRAIQCSREYEKFLKSISIHFNCSFMQL